MRYLCGRGHYSLLCPIVGHHITTLFGEKIRNFLKKNFWEKKKFSAFFGLFSLHHSLRGLQPLIFLKWSPFYGWPNPLALVNKNSQTTSIYRVISFISSELFRGTCYFGNVWWTTISNNMWHNIMSKAILGFGVSVTRLAALAGSKLASTPSNDDIVKSPGVWTGVQNVCQNITFTMVWT